jgi:hypothetical protein
METDVIQDVRRTDRVVIAVKVNMCSMFFSAAASILSIKLQRPNKNHINSIGCMKISACRDARK